MYEERRRILSMLAEGKVTTEEAEELLDALGGAESTGSAPPPARSKEARFMYVKVESTGGDNVDVKVPLGLIRAGVKLTSLIPPQAMSHINEKMSEHGMQLDINNLRQEDLEELVESLTQMEVNVKSKEGDDIRVHCA